MTLAELQAETLSQKNTRLLQERCPHEEVYVSTVTGPHGHSENRLCLDCYKSWHYASNER